LSMEIDPTHVLLSIVTFTFVSFALWLHSKQLQYYQKIPLLSLYACPPPRFFFGHRIDFSSSPLSAIELILLHALQRKRNYHGYFIAGAFVTSLHKQDAILINTSHIRTVLRACADKPRAQWLANSIKGISGGSSSIYSCNGDEWKAQKVCIDRAELGSLANSNQALIFILKESSDILHRIIGQEKTSSTRQRDVDIQRVMRKVSVLFAAHGVLRVDKESAHELSAVTTAVNSLVFEDAARRVPSLNPTVRSWWFPSTQNWRAHRSLQTVSQWLNKSMTSDSFSSRIGSANAAFLLTHCSSTLSSTLSFAFHLIAVHQDIQSRIFEEASSINLTQQLEHFSRSSNTFTSGLFELVFTKLSLTYAVILESLRLFPAIPILLRETDNDNALDETHSIPKGIAVWISVWHAQRDHRHWGESSAQFHPERMLNKRGNEREFEGKWFPFASGSRSCPGMRFAIVHATLILATMVSEFHFDQSRKTAPKLTLSCGSGILECTDGVFVQVETRGKSNR